MPRLFALFFGSVVRWGVTLLAGWLIARGVVSQQVGDELIAGLVISVPPLLWGLWQKYKSRLGFLTALELPAKASEDDVKEILKNSTQAEKMRFVTKQSVKSVSPLLLLLCLLPFLLFTQACPLGGKADNSTKDGLREIAAASHKIANTVEKGRAGLRKLKEKGLVDTQEARDVTAALLDVSRITDTFSEKARQHQAFNGTAKAELDQWVVDLAEANKKLIGDGSYHIRNPTAKTEFSAIVGSIATLIQTITQLAGTLKPVENANEPKQTIGIGSEAGSRLAHHRRMDRTEQLLRAAGAGLVASGQGGEIAFA